MKRYIVIDKSFLQGAPKHRIENLSSEYGLLMTEAMLYELIKASPIDRAKFFLKFPSIERPFELSRNIGYFLRYELNNNSSCGLPSRHIRHIDHTVTARYSDPGFAIPPSLNEELNIKKLEVEEDLEQFLYTIRSVEEFFPELAGVPGNGQKEAIKSIQEKICNDEQFLINGVISSLRNSPLYPGVGPEVNCNWFSYRWLQVQLLYAVDYWFRYPLGLGDNESPKQRERVKHDILDAEYLTVSLQEGAIATKDRKLCEWWNKLLPGGVLHCD